MRWNPVFSEFVVVFKQETGKILPTQTLQKFGILQHLEGSKQQNPGKACPRVSQATILLFE